MNKTEYSNLWTATVGSKITYNREGYQPVISVVCHIAKQRANVAHPDRRASTTPDATIRAFRSGRSAVQLLPKTIEVLSVH